MPARYRARAALLSAILCLVALSTAALAQGRSLLRDPDIEHGLRELARPLIAAAGMNPAQVDILVINDDRMNAFVASDRLMVLHSGLILRLDSAAELQAVIAHEVAHIANGHFARRQANARASSRVAAVGLAVGLAAALAGNPDVASGAALGASAGANNVFLGHTRAEEASADASGLRYMAEAGIDPKAMVTVLDRFRGQEALVVGRQDAFVRTHPLTRDRLRDVRARVSALEPRELDSASADYWFARTKGKLSAFLRNPAWTLRRVNASDQTDVGMMRRAVALHRKPDPEAAHRAIDALAAKRPNDPFVAELQGQIYLESGAIGKAVRAYDRAAKLAPSDGLVLASYGRALLAAERPESLQVLRRARERDPRNPRLLRDLARSFAAAGDGGNASLATAERYVLLGQLNDAGIHAGRAVDLLPRGSPAWRRADEILALSRRNGGN